MIVAIAVGLLIGLSLGALGGGGSILTVPALVYVLGQSAPAAVTASLVIVGVAALTGAAGHALDHHVRWIPGLLFAAFGAGASYAGTALSRQVDPNVLLLAFAGLMLLAGAGMLRRSAERARPTAENTDLAALVVAGAFVGFLTGFFGVGGGFVIVPALVMALGYDMPAAVGTSLLVIAVNSAVALAARAGHESFHWAVIVPFTVAAVLGSLAGRQVATRLPSTQLRRAFVALLFAVACYTAVRSGIGVFS